MAGADNRGALASNKLDATELSSCLGNLVSLLALPSLCQQRTPRDILALALDALSPLLEFDLGFLRVAGPQSIEALRHRGLDASTDSQEALARLRDFVASHLTMPPVPAGTCVQAPCGLGPLRVVVVPLGFYADTGMLFLASRRDDFPTTSELIQIRAAASLVASTIEGALAREKLELARRELEAASRAKDEFLAMLGHELRNPLAPIVTALELMRLRGGDATRERTIIERQVTHMRQLVDDLLDISRITRGMVELKRQRLELAEIVTKAVEVASPLLESRRHHLTVRCPQRGLLVDVDPVRAAQIVSNLLTNAAKYTEPGGRITITAEHDGEWASVSVCDNGIGIAPEMLPRVFELFAQERRAIDRAEGGLGLGLAIVKSLVELHRGRVEVASEGLGHGSRFTVRLPVASASPPAQPDRAAPRSQRQAPASAAPEAHRILIVDDNVDAGELLAAFVSHLGFHVTLAHDGAEALRLAKALMPEIVLLDIGLPVMDGYEVAAQLREHPTLRSMRLVAVTGYGQKSDRLRSRAAGFAAHLVKPIDLDALSELLHTLLTPAGVEV